MPIQPEEPSLWVSNYVKEGVLLVGVASLDLIVYAPVSETGEIDREDIQSSAEDLATLPIGWEWKRFRLLADDPPMST